MTEDDLRVGTRHGQYRVVDHGAATELRYAWVERVGRDERTMCAFVLFTDAVEMLPAYQAREARERTGTTLDRRRLLEFVDELRAP